MKYLWPFLFATTVWAQTPYPPDKPFLRIETGMHTATIYRIDSDAEGRYLVSASEDKTARVWDLRNGQLLRVLRPPQGDGTAGQVFAVAMSPDGSTIALGGFTSPDGSSDYPVYIFDRATGAILRSIHGLPTTTNHLAYSRDGRRLALVLTQDEGIRVYETRDYREIARDTKYDGDTTWAEFDKVGRLVTASWDGKVRLYPADLNGRPLARQVPGGKHPESARFSPDGQRIAVAFDDSSEVTIVSGRNLHSVSSPKTPFDSPNLLRTAWSADGRTLCAGGKYSTSDGLWPILCWDTANFGNARTLAVALESITDLRFVAGNRLAFASAEPEIGLLDSNGVFVWPRRIADIADLAGQPDGLRVDANGAVEFRTLRLEGNSWEQKLLRFVPDSRQLSAIDRFSTDTPLTTGLNVQNWNGKTDPTLDSKPLKIRTDDQERSESLVIFKDASRFVLGCDWSIRVYDRNGVQERTIPIPEGGFSVNLTPDSRHVVAALGDGTVRWYEIDTGNEVLALFVHPDLQRWIAWTPEGFFDSSPGGESLIGYHLNRGADHEGEFVKVDQLFDTFYRPDLVSQRLKPGGAEAVATALAKVGKIDDILAGGLAPDIRIVNTRQTETGEIVLEYEIHDRGGGIGRIIPKVDGTPVFPRDSNIPSVGIARTIILPPLTPGTRNLSISGNNRAGKLESTSPTVPLNVANRGAGSILYVVAAGVSHYQIEALNSGVQFAAADAKQIAGRLQQTARGIFDRVNADVLTDPTRDQLEGKIRDVISHLRPTDGFVLYLAGHGTVVSGEYYFLPADGQNTSETTLRASAVSRERLQPLLEKIPGNKTLLLIDTCSGAALQEHDLALDAIDRLGRNASRAVLAGAASGKMAFEGSNNHGVFTDALLAGLSEAQPDQQGNILVSRLAEFVQQRVPDITRHWGIEQKPEVFLHGDLFAIARR